jgi:hypothetical protein
MKMKINTSKRFVEISLSFEDMEKLIKGKSIFPKLNIDKRSLSIVYSFKKAKQPKTRKVA